MNIPNSRRLCRPVSLVAMASLVALLSSPTLAQNAPSRASTTASGDEVVTLSEFTVSADSQAGYLASESATGSRLPTKIKDLPYTIGVITSEFFNDFAIFDNSQIFEGGVITDDQDAGGGYTVRGISNTGQLYNGFWQPAGTPVPNALKDRSEILYGPSAGVYGQTGPGGIINIVSKQPRMTPRQTLRFTVGSYDEHDVRFESTGPLTSKTAYLFIANYNERAFNQPWHENRSRTAALTLQHQINASSNLRVEFVASSQRNHSPCNRVPYLYDSKNQIVYGIAYELMDKSNTGPNSYKNIDNYSVFGTYEKRFSPMLSLRVGSDYYSVHTRSFNTTDVTAYDPDPTHAGTDLYSSTFYGITRLRSTSSSYSAPSYKLDYKDGGGLQADLLARYLLLNGKVENRTLLTFDFSSVYNYVIKKGMPGRVSLNSNGTPKTNSDGSLSTNNAADPTIFPLVPRFAGDLSYWQPVINPLGPQTLTDPASGLPFDIYNLPDAGSSQFQLSSWQKSRTDAFGTMLRHQATLWNRLLLFAAVRFDNVMYNNYSITYPSWSAAWHPEWQQYYDASFKAKNTSPPIQHYHATAWTPSTGFNFRLPRGVALYGNYSSSFKVSTQQITGATRGSYYLPNERGIGYDYGFKGSALEDRINWTLGGFYVIQKNRSVTSDAGDGTTIKEAIGTVVSKGMTLSGSYALNQNWAFNGAYHMTDARWGNTGVDLDLAGRRKALVPPDIVTFASNYSFSGPLKGLRAVAMYQYAGATRADDGGSKSVSGSIFIPRGSNNGLRNIILPSYGLINAGFTYDLQSRALAKTMRHRLQFNVGNVMDKHYVTYSRGVGDNRVYKFTYQGSF